MGLETGTYIADLVTSNPPGNDPRSQGDDHIRLLKAVLQNTFPGANKPFPFPAISASQVLDFTVLSTEMNKTFQIDTTGGVVNATLPLLGAGDAGWFCFFIKTNAGVNPYYIVPPAGNIQSGRLSIAKTRRCIVGTPCRVFWTGTMWVAERAEKSPVGSLVDFECNFQPIGYELPNGQTLAGVAGSVYPDYFAAKGSLVTSDITGRVVAMKEAAATRLTAGGSGIDGATFGAAGGEQTHTLTQAQLPAVAPTFTGTPQTVGLDQTGVLISSGVHMTAGASSFGGNVSSPDPMTVTFTPSGTISNLGSGNAHSNTQPTIVLFRLLVVE